MAEKEIKFPEHMKKESIEALKKIRENGYDYKQVEKTLIEATESMLNNSKKLMNPRVINVLPNSNFTLTLTFSNQEVRTFDMNDYLEIGTFQDLKNLEYFNNVRVVLGSIQWPNGQDLCPDTLYLESIKSK